MDSDWTELGLLESDQTPIGLVGECKVLDQFNDSRQEESRCLNLNWKMEHDEKMASICLKRHKYNLQYGSMPQTPAGYSTPVLAPVIAATTKEDKQIEILRLQIRLTELTWDNSYHASLSHALSSQQMQHNSHEEESTLNSGMSTLSYVGLQVDNNFISEDSGRYYGEASGSSGVASPAWPESYNFSA